MQQKPTTLAALSGQGSCLAASFQEERNMESDSVMALLTPWSMLRNRTGSVREGSHYTICNQCQSGIAQAH